jgi:uncharacterized protein (TIGR03086 family)
MTTSPEGTGPTATTARSLLPPAADRVGFLVHAVAADAASDAWDRPTPCQDWSVRDLVNHLVAEHLWCPPLLAGSTLAEVGDEFDGDVLGDAPAAAWDDAIVASLRSWAMAREDQVVDLSFGPTPASEYAEQMLVDLVVHGWDLARGAGLDDTVDDALAEHVLAYLEPMAAGWAAAGAFAPPVPTSRTDPAGRLVALTGRDPEWSPGG